jgi:hypothetical protein
MSEHHQLPLVTKDQISAMVDKVRAHLDSLEVSDSITVV